VLTSRRAKRMSTSTARLGAVLILSFMSFPPAFAGNVSSWSCVGWWTGSNCVNQSRELGDPYVRLVPEPLGEAEKGQITARDNKWLAHCRPVIEHDRYGVARYRYSAPGCEFGAGAD
jgi:hypothetical protein